MALPAARPCSFSLIFPAKPGWSDLNQGSNNLKRCRCYQCSWGPLTNTIYWGHDGRVQLPNIRFSKLVGHMFQKHHPTLRCHILYVYIICIFHTYIFIYTWQSFGWGWRMSCFNVIKFWMFWLAVEGPFSRNGFRNGVPSRLGHVSDMKSQMVKCLAAACF